MLKILFLLLLIFLTSGCAVQSVTELKSDSKIHRIYYYNGSIEDIYNSTIKKYNECGIPISNSFLDLKSREAGISYAAVGYGWYSHEDFKEENNRVRVDIYSITDIGIPGNFLKIAKYALESKVGCPPDLF